MLKSEVRLGFNWIWIDFGLVNFGCELRLSFGFKLQSRIRIWIGLAFRHSLGRSIPYSLGRVISGLSILKTSMDLFLR